MATLNTYAMSGIGNAAAGGTYSSALVQALLGGYGNTIPTLFALVTALLGLARTWIGSFSGDTAWIAGKAFSAIVLLGTLLALFSNGLIIYLKSKPDGLIYIELLGPIYFEIAVCILLMAGFFAKSFKND